MARLTLYKVNVEYINYLYSIDKRVSTKCDGRPFVGIITNLNGHKYVIPLTSQTNELRIKNGLKARTAKTTIKVTDSSGKEIADLLFNNMVPVSDENLTKLNITPNDTYELSEIRLIRNNNEKSIKKADKVYNARISGEDEFLKRICCDFKKLEEACELFNKSHHNKEE